VQSLPTQDPTTPIQPVTLACAVAAAAVKHGFADQRVQIQMEGGSLLIEVTDDFRISMTGPASEICSGILSPDLLKILAHEEAGSSDA
jgi:hypothetical protein